MVLGREKLISSLNLRSLPTFSVEVTAPIVAYDVRFEFRFERNRQLVSIVGAQLLTGADDEEIILQIVIDRDDGQRLR